MDTICAISTAQGGAIGIVRISGNNALNICSSIFRSARGIQLTEVEPRLSMYGSVIDPENISTIDDVVVLTYHSPHSYTGEDCVEIMCHGSSYILQKILDLLISHGCVMARPGEFTKRAFLNGKMDLSQAEAVADLIASTNAASHKLAMNQMRGGISRELKLLRDKLIHLTSLMELELDFSEEDVEFADRKELFKLSDEIRSTLIHLIKSFKLGNAIKNGIPVAIIGETNVGKSTLLNRLLREDRAIVSNIHGTTRDTIEDTIIIDGTLYRFIDTAGIRETDNEIEAIGIERTYAKIDAAQIVIWVVDAQDIKHSFIETHKLILPHLFDKTLIVAINKCDLVDEEELYNMYNELYDESGINPDETVLISAQTGKNVETLEFKLHDYVIQSNYNENDVIVTNIRHVEALSSALSSIESAIKSLKYGLSGDLVAEDMRMCINSLGEIVGEVTNDEVLGNIFNHFCIGK